MVERPYVAEDAGHGVIIARRDRIEFMVMTARATDGLGEECLADGIQLLIDHIHVELLLVLLFKI